MRVGGGVVSTPEILTVEDCFAAAENAEAIRKIRVYLASIEQSIDYCRQRNGRPCSPCHGRQDVVTAVRALLPALAGEGDVDDDRDL